MAISFHILFHSYSLKSFFKYKKITSFCNFLDYPYAFSEIRQCVHVWMFVGEFVFVRMCRVYQCASTYLGVSVYRYVCVGVCVRVCVTE